jgi:hypothetical protein
MSGICDTCRRKPCPAEGEGLRYCDFYEDGETRFEKLFGTPEKAAQTLEEFELDQFSWCHGTGACEKCPYEFDRYGCYLPDGFSLLEWLRGDA